MENALIIKNEIEIAAQRIIQQVMITNDQVKEQVEAGVKRAFEKFDFETEIEKAITGSIERAIRDSSQWGKISKLVYEKADEIIQAFIDKQIKEFEEKLK